MKQDSQPTTKHFCIIFLIFSTLWNQGHPKRVRVSSSVALSICELHTQFTETGEIQPAIKTRPDSHSSVPCSWYKHPDCSNPDEPDSCAVVEKPCDTAKKGRTALVKAGGSSKAIVIKSDINDISTDVQEDEFEVRQGRFIFGSLIAGAVGLIGGIIGVGAAIVGGIIHKLAAIKGAIIKHVGSVIGAILDKIAKAIDKIVNGIAAKIKWLVGLIFDVVGQLIMDKAQLLKCIIHLICSVVDKWTDGNGMLVAIRGEIGNHIKGDVQYIVDKIVSQKQKVIDPKTFLIKDLLKRCRAIVDKIISIKEALIKTITDKLTGLIEKIINLKQKIIDAVVEKLKLLVKFIFGVGGAVLVKVLAIVGAIVEIICEIIDKLLGLAGAFFNVKWAIIQVLKDKFLALAQKIIDLKGNIGELIGDIGDLIGGIIESKWELIGMLGERLVGCFTIQCLSCKNCAVCPHEAKFIQCKKSLGCGTFYNEDGTVDRGCFHKYWKEPGCYDDFTKCSTCNPNPGKPGNTTYCKCNTDKCNAEDCGDDDGGPDQSLKKKKKKP